MGASIAYTYQQQNRIPQEVYVAMVSYANNTSDKGLQSAVNSSAKEVAQQQPELSKAITKALQTLPARVYFHIRDEADRAGAEQLERTLENSSIEGNSIIVPGIEKVTGPQKKSLLKCFKQTECDALGGKLVAFFQANGVAVELSNQSAVYPTSTGIRPNHFELWLAPGSVASR